MHGARPEYFGSAPRLPTCPIEQRTGIEFEGALEYFVYDAGGWLVEQDCNDKSRQA